MIKEGEYYNEKLARYNFSSELQKCIREACRYCIDKTNNADAEKRISPIMMLGEIQSGKTRAFTGLMALAFDNDFDIIIILTKNSKALVKQTEKRMKKEFSDAIKVHKLKVTNIINYDNRKKLNGYEKKQKHVIIAKKQKQNLDKLINFIEDNSLNANKKCLIIDDEADTTGIGYSKNKSNDDFDLRTVASKVDEMRGTLDGCVFVQVTATPYALYLQPDFDENEIKPVKPYKTIILPTGDGYVGGDYYFIKSQDREHPSSFLFEPMSNEELELVSQQKRKGKKSKINDKRSFKIEEILENKKHLAVLKNSIVNFIVGAIILKQFNPNNQNKHYSFVIHTATQKNMHAKMDEIVSELLKQMRERNENTTYICDELLRDSYYDLKKSVELFSRDMPSLSYVEEQFYEVIDEEYYCINTVNSNTDVDNLLDEETGELDLRTPYSIFVGGQTLDRGITIPNMIGFYYGRSPKTMQQDTVMQHSRMFGYRKELLPVTRFYTSIEIYETMRKIVEIDRTLRDDIKNEKQGNGVYFITKCNNINSVKKIAPCSPSKIALSDIILFKENRRLLPKGFTPAIKSEGQKSHKRIVSILKKYNVGEGENKTVYFQQDDLIELINQVYQTFEFDENIKIDRFTLEEFETTLNYMNSKNLDLPTIIRWNRNISKFNEDGISLIDSPYTGSKEGKEANSLAIDSPSIILTHQLGNKDGWKFRPFWWPVLVSPQNIKKTIYASKVPGEKIKRNN